MNEEDKETKLVSNLEFVSGLFGILAILLLILRIIIDTIYGGTHFEKTGDILLIIAFFTGSLASGLEKRFITSLFFGILFIFFVLSLLGI